MHDIIVIGGGPGGYVAAIRASQLGMKVALIEKRKQLGGTCLNVGCIPSKYLLHIAECYHVLKTQGKALGIECSALKPNLKTMIEGKRQVIDSFSGGIDGLMGKNKITRIEGSASFVDAHTIKVEGKDYQAKYFIIATGSEPIALPFMPFDAKHILSSDHILDLETIPRSMIVIGGGVIGLEMGSVFSKLGAQVEVVEAQDTLCPFFDPQISKALHLTLQSQGLNFSLSTQVKACHLKEGGVELELIDNNKKEKTLKADKVLVAIGRRAYTEGLGLENIGLSVNQQKKIPIDGMFGTSLPHVFAIGDVVDGPMLAHKASEEGIICAELIAGQRPKLNYMAIPNVVYTHPEVATVGLTEQQAKAEGLQLLTGKFPFKANSRAKANHMDEGFVKLLFEKKTQHMIGAHIIGPHASELIAQAALAIQNKITLEGIIHTSYAHPTLSEAFKEAALHALKSAIHI